MTARALAAVIKQEAPGLALFGRQAIDDDMGAVGAAVAELLGWPCASWIMEESVDEAGKTIEENDAAKFKMRLATDRATALRQAIQACRIHRRTSRRAGARCRTSRTPDPVGFRIPCRIWYPARSRSGNSSRSQHPRPSPIMSSLAEKRLPEKGGLPTPPKLDAPA